MGVACPAVNVGSCQLLMSAVGVMDLECNSPCPEPEVIVISSDSDSEVELDSEQNLSFTPTKK